MRDRLYNGQARKVDVVFCTPGSTFSRAFFYSWNHLMNYCFSKGISAAFSTGESNNIYQVRNLVMEGQWGAGEYQKPFSRSDLDYDHIMFIDSDQVYSVDNFIQLWQHRAHDIVSGWYSMPISQDFPFTRSSFGTWKRNPNWYRADEIESLVVDQDGLFDVDYNGMGWMLVKKGVFEKIPYPWFTVATDAESTAIIGAEYDVVTDDASFCIKAQKAGFRVKVDPSIRVGHYKPVVL